MNFQSIMQDGLHVQHSEEIAITVFTSLEKLRLHPDLGNLKSEMDRVARSGFQSGKDRYMEGIEHQIQESTIIVFAHGSDNFIGFLTGTYIQEADTMYLHGCVIDKDYQASGLGRIMVEKLLNQTTCSTINAYTQNPRVYKLLSKFCRKLYPSPKDPILPPFLLKIMAKVHHSGAGDLQAETSVARNIYTTPLYGEVPMSGDIEIDSWFIKTLEIKEGRSPNAFLLIGERI